MIYKKRIADSVLSRMLEEKGAVLIKGLKCCGKTTTAEKHTSSVLYADDPRRKAQNLAMADLNPEIILRGPYFIK